MLLLPQTVKVKWYSANIKWYKSKGYLYTKIGDEFELDVLDLLGCSRVFVKLICDYCGKLYKKTYQNYIHQNSKSTIHKDCCIDCKHIKKRESNIIVYGIDEIFKLPEIRNKISDNYKNKNEEELRQIKNKRENTNYIKYGQKYYAQTDEYKEKMRNISINKYGTEYHISSNVIKNKSKQTSLERYGVECPLQSKEIRNKIINTNLIKYGCENPMQNEDIKLKQINTLYKNSSAQCSTQQRYIHQLIGGELNYPFYNILLDIAFPENKIYIEYDGSGHDLCVKLGTESQSDFDNRQIKRNYLLYRNKWKGIRIISKKDLLPNDNNIIEIIEIAKTYFNTGHSWIEFNIDNQLVKCSQFEDVFKYGELRKITKNMLYIGGDFNFNNPK